MTARLPECNSLSARHIGTVADARPSWLTPATIADENTCSSPADPGPASRYPSTLLLIVITSGFRDAMISPQSDTAAARRGVHEVPRCVRIVYYSR